MLESVIGEMTQQPQMSRGPLATVAQQCPRTRRRFSTPSCNSIEAPRDVLRPFGVVLAVGFLACLLVSMPDVWPGNETRFVTSRRVVVAATAAVALAVGSGSLGNFDELDWSVLGWLAVLALTGMAAVNPWLAVKALALSLSAVLTFLQARALRRHELPTMAALVTGTACLACLLALGEAYGLLPAISRPGRAPGGVLGNRNELAHLAAIIAPSNVWLAVRAGWSWHRRLAIVCVPVLAAALALTRCRAAWLGLATATAVGVALNVRARRARVRNPEGSVRQFLFIGALAAAGVLVAVVTPNRLAWNSSTPWRDTAATLLDAREGSGHDRIVQYGRTVELLWKHPLLGVGVGNWWIAYTSNRAAEMPTLDPGEVNSLPSSDWIGGTAETGLLGAGVMLLVCWAVCRRTTNDLTCGLADLTVGERERWSVGVAQVCTLAVVAVLGAVDSPLARPTTLFAAAITVGMLLPRPVKSTGSRRRSSTQTVGALVCCAAAAWDGARARSAWLYRSAQTPSELSAVVRLDPTAYQSRAAYVRALGSARHCDEADKARQRTLALFPAYLAQLEEPCHRLVTHGRGESP